MAARGSARFYVQVQNDGRSAADIRVVGSRETAAFAVRYYLGSRQVSPMVKDGNLVFTAVAPGAARTLTVEIEAKAAAGPGDRRRVVVSARSVALPDVRDNVVAEVERPVFRPEQRRIADLVNGSRRANGRGTLSLHRQLAAKAQGWAEHMASEGRLSHSDLRQGVPSGSSALAENVGMGSSLSEVHTTFMSSSSHRQNILGAYSSVGTGYASGHGRVWIVQIFMAP